MELGGESMKLKCIALKNMIIDACNFNRMQKRN